MGNSEKITLRDYRKFKELYDKGYRWITKSSVDLILGFREKPSTNRFGRWVNFDDNMCHLILEPDYLKGKNGIFRLEYLLSLTIDKIHTRYLSTNEVLKSGYDFNDILLEEGSYYRIDCNVDGLDFGIEDTFFILLDEPMTLKECMELLSVDSYPTVLFDTNISDYIFTRNITLVDGKDIDDAIHFNMGLFRY